MRSSIIIAAIATGLVAGNPLFPPKSTPTAPAGYALAEGKGCFDAFDCLPVNFQVNNKCIQHKCYTMTSTGSNFGLPTWIPGELLCFLCLPRAILGFKFQVFLDMSLMPSSLIFAFECSHRRHYLPPS